MSRLRFYGPLLALSIMGCGGATEDYEAPQMPPPPPPAPVVEPAPAPEPYDDSSGPATAPPSPPPPAPPTGQTTQATPAAPPAPPPPPAAPPQVSTDSGGQLVYSYPSGQWVYVSDRGWVWVPADAVTTETEGVPYAYLYTPSYGWTWYVSPWGVGRYRYGVWARHPWHPVGWHGRWVAHPTVVVHLGPGRRRYRR